MFSPYARESLSRTLPDNMRPRIARPRGGRRPPTQARPVGSNASPLSQSQSFPAPSWGANNSTTSNGTQQASNNFAFGQSSEPFSQSTNPTESNEKPANSQSLSFPPFGGFNTGFGQQASAPSPASFNFAAPSTINNPFANLNQNVNTQPTSSGATGNLFGTPVKSNPTFAEQAKEQEKLSTWERKPPSHWMTGLPPEEQDSDPQSFFVSHAPFKWGQADPPAQSQSQQPTSETNSASLGQQHTQTPANLFGQNEQPKHDSTNMFAHLQQPSSSASNPFAQQTGQQSQTSNANGQQKTPPFQLQSNQTPSNPFAFLGSATQGQTQSTMFNKSATSPTKDGDSMSTTPDTSPQSNNDRERYGAFASVTAAPKPPIINGSTPSGAGSNLFSFPSNPLNPSNNQSSTSNPFGSVSNDSDIREESRNKDDAPPDISLGSPSKKQSAPPNKTRKIAQPTMGRPHIEDKTPAKNPFAGFSLPSNASVPSTNSPATNGASNPFQNQSNASSGTSTNNDSTLFRVQDMHSSKPQDFSVPREAGLPPSPPDDFTEDQKRQYITGWRLKSLDKGLQTYLEYSSYSDQEIESISTFYHLRKKAILDANGGPVKEINSKRGAQYDGHQSGSQSKKARRQAPSAPSEQVGHTSKTNSTSNGNAKRKATEDLSKSDGQTQSDSVKRSKAEDQVTYPSLPSSSSSQTAKMFGNLVGKKSDTGISNAGSPDSNGNLSKGLMRSDTAFTPAGSSKSSLFFQAPDTDSGQPKKQTSFFNFPAGSASGSPQPKPTNPDSSTQSLSAQSSSPFKGFFPSQSSHSTSTSSAISKLPSNASWSTTQPPNQSNGDNAQQMNAKRKASILGPNGDPGDELNSEDSQEQRTKKQRREDKSKATTDGDKESVYSTKANPSRERTGFGESIFSRPGMIPTSTSNMFSHLGNLPNQQKDDDADADNDDNEGDDEDDPPEKTRRGAKQTNTSISTNEASNISKPNAFGSSVFNPFAGSSFNTPKKPSDEGRTAERSLFDRIERDSGGQPMKAPTDFKNVDFGQSILNTPKTGVTLNSTSQAPSANIFGGISPAPGGNAASNPDDKSTSSTPAQTPAFNLFGQPSSSNTAPMANMTGSKDVGASPGSDLTWKAGTPVKFSETSGAPILNFTSPSPSKAPLSGLFGSPKASSTAETPGSSMFKTFDASSAKPAPLTFGISAPPKDSLAPPSETQSESTSRATSPGAGESGNEASDQVHEEESHPELDTTEASRAEADEDTIFEVKAKAHKMMESKHFNGTTGKEEITRQWKVQGVEQLRVLKHRDTKKTRILMKLKVNGRVVLNAGLQKSLTYELASPKVVRVPVATESKVESWTIQVGKEEDAKELAKLLEENKAN
ncbi:MAG: hypothetical protein Q9204_000137 [Flavoplaca sp. TL-2023a]